MAWNGLGGKLPGDSGHDGLYATPAHVESGSEITVARSERRQASDISHVALSETRASVFLSLGLPPLAAHVCEVLRIGPWFQVVRIAARRVVTGVHEQGPGGDRSVAHLPRNTVGSPRFAADGDEGVAAPVYAAKPPPAPMLVANGHGHDSVARVVEAHYERAKLAGLSLHAPMAMAKTLRRRLLAAFRKRANAHQLSLNHVVYGGCQ